VITTGTIGFWLLGFSALDALYQTVITVTTVGFREVEPLSGTGKVFTMALILTGVGTVLYTLSAVLEMLIEGQLRDILGRRRMERDIKTLSGHTIVCGWGRVGTTIAQYMSGSGTTVVVIDEDAERLADCAFASVVGDATSDDVLAQAGVDRAGALVAAVSEDAANLFVVVSARALRPDLFIVARVRSEANESKMLRAGANRVVNPQRIGGARMAAFVSQPHVAEFLDVVMHDGSLEFRLGEIAVGASSPAVGQSLRDAHLRDQTGALVLAIRTADGSFVTNPPPTTVLESGHVLIAVGTQLQLDELRKAAAG
jgi:voltage-gated potassium channel